MEVEKGLRVLAEVEKGLRVLAEFEFRSVQNKTYEKQIGNLPILEAKRLFYFWYSYVFYSKNYQFLFISSEYSINSPLLIWEFFRCIEVKLNKIQKCYIIRHFLRYIVKKIFIILKDFSSKVVKKTTRTKLPWLLREKTNRNLFNCYVIIIHFFVRNFVDFLLNICKTDIYILKLN